MRSTLGTGVSRFANQQILTSSLTAKNDITSKQLAKFYSTRLAEVGKFEVKLSEEICYPAGQAFLHKVFGYRGVTLFPWLARVHDNDVDKLDLGTHHQTKGNRSGQESHKCSDVVNHSFEPIVTPKSQKQQRKNSEHNVNQSIRNTQLQEPVFRYHPFYQVLIDSRDCPYVSNRTQTEAVTFLGHPDNSKSVYSIKGLDYVAHEDILPYTSSEEQPIHHELHDNLFKFVSDAETSIKFKPTELLDNWRSRHPWLELSRVYRETTENIRISVIPFYLGHTHIEDTSFHWWRYCVRIENLGETSVHLRERHWKISSHTNTVQTIKGRGVVGVEPLLTKKEPAYQYSSHVNLQHKSGKMWGTFKMQSETGHMFECKIPAFTLNSSLDDDLANHD